MAVGAPLATHLLVTARTAGGLSLFAVDLVFDAVRLPADALLGDEGRAWPSLERACDEGAAAVCAEAVGAMRKVLADTVEHCKQRHQFGQSGLVNRHLSAIEAFNLLRVAVDTDDLMPKV